MRKLKITSGPLREISFIAITWIPESNCSCRKKNHVLFCWSTSTVPEPLIRHWISCWRNILTINGTWMKKENFQMHGLASQDSFHWTKGHLTDMHDLVGDLRGNKQPQDPTMYGQICGSICLMQRKAKRSKRGLSRNQKSILPGNYVVPSSLNQMMNNLNTPWKTIVESWKFRCQQQCLVKTPVNCRRETRRTIGKHKTKYACIVDADESMRLRLEGVPHRCHEDHISAKGNIWTFWL